MTFDVLSSATTVDRQKRLSLLNSKISKLAHDEGFSLRFIKNKTRFRLYIIFLGIFNINNAAPKS